MTNKEFIGTSESGNFEAALQSAIQNAKDGLGPTNYVSWKVLEISGESGGFVRVNTLNVKISAEPPSD